MGNAVTTELFTPSEELNMVGQGLTTIPVDELKEEADRRAPLELIADFNLIDSIPDMHPGLLAVASRLTELSLSCNRLSSLPRCLAQMRAMKRLLAGANTLKAIPRGTLPPFLETLKLDSNELTTLDGVETLRNLRVLSASFNPISSLPPRLPDSLASLCLQGLQLTEFPACTLQLPNLHDLDLSENRIAAIPPTLGRSSPRLVKLFLARNRIPFASDIRGLASALPPRLQLLDLSYNDLGSDEVTRLPEFIPTLTRLVLSSNPFLGAFTKPSSPRAMSALQLDWDLPDEIVPGIYLGSVECAWNRHGARQLGITHILTIACYQPPYPDLFTYNVVPLDDRNSEDILSCFPQCCEFILKALAQGGKVLVHCRHGASRSPTVVMAFLVKHQGLTAHQAYAFVKARRPQVSPNDGFVAQLGVWEQQQMKHR